MNATPDFNAQTVIMWMLIPALICLFGIGIGIVTAFRRGDARIPLAIGGLGFVALLFSLPFASPPGRVQSSPIAVGHSASPHMQPLPVFNTQLAVVPLLFLVLIAGAIVAGIVAAIRHGYGKVVLIVGAIGLVGLLVIGFTSTGIQVHSSPTAFDYATSQHMQSPPGFAPDWLMLLAPALPILIMWMVLQRRDRGDRQMLVPLVVVTVCVGGVFALANLRSVGPYTHTRPEPNPLPEPPRDPFEKTLTANPADQPATPSGLTPSQILYTTGHAQPIPIQELPGWRKNPPHEGSLGAGWSKYVLTSEQFATVEEAENELYKTLTADVQQGFAYHHPATTGWVPTREDLQVSGLIAERVIETLPLKVGEFENTVHRVSWLVEFKPETNQALHARWEPGEAQRRSKLILSILAGASGVLGITAMAMRRRRDQSVPVEATASGSA